MTEAEKDEEIKRLDKKLKHAHIIYGELYREVQAIKEGKPIVVTAGQQYELRQYKRLFQSVTEAFFCYKREIMGSEAENNFFDTVGDLVKQYEEDDQL